jgi:hypothetical protein
MKEKEGTKLEPFKCLHCGCEELHGRVGMSCGNCIHNGVMIDGTNEYEHPISTHEERTQCYDEDECDYGPNTNGGCVLLTCAKCKRVVQFFPLDL